MSDNKNKSIKSNFTNSKDSISEPLPASTVLLVRDTISSIEVFMLKRAATTNFGNAWVFPGGKVDEEDVKKTEDNIYSLAAIRECFEESGVLIAYDKHGKIYTPADQKEADLLKKYQRSINDKKLSFYNVLDILDLKPAFDQLNFFSHWITPQTEKKRYNTKFFLAYSPNNLLAIHDGFEGVESVWISPQEALKLHSAGKFPIILPTIKSLEILNIYNSSSDLLKINFREKSIGNYN